MDPQYNSSEGRTQAKLGLRNSISEFIGLANDRPIYVAARVAEYGIEAVSAIEACLRRAHPGIEFVFARERYRDTADWRQRWATERGHFGGIILLTWANVAPDPYGTPRGEHAIGLGMMRELLDISRDARPVLWLANEFPQWFTVARFSIKRPSGEFSARSFGSLAPWNGAEPFKPGISPILVRIAGAFERASQ